MQLRKPAVAGSFYPARPDRLRRQVVELLTDARTALKITPKALIAPHAGYIYSGRVAALAFATLFDSAPTLARIVLIGPAHYVAIRGVACPAIDACGSLEHTGEPLDVLGLEACENGFQCLHCFLFIQLL